MEAVLLYKKEDPLKKENYRSASLLPHVSKVLERIVYKQANVYMQNKLSKQMTGLWKSYEIQHSSIAMLEKWKIALDKGEFCFSYWSIQDLWHSKSRFITSKAKRYGFAIKALGLMRSYLKNRRHLVKITTVTQVQTGVP